MSVLEGTAQTAVLEFASGGTTGGIGSTITPQVVTFKQNTSDPVGSTFVAFNNPTTTATLSFSNQQYPLATTQMPAANSMVFGAAINASNAKAANSSQYEQMSAIGSPSNGNFTSTNVGTPGTGISVTNNYASEVFISSAALYNHGLGTNASYYMGDFNITFNVPVNNPVIHIVGMGATNNGLGFSSEFDLYPTPGVTLSKLSGSSELSVASNKIYNNSANPTSTTGSGAASGSILASGTNITSLSFKVYLVGNGGGSWGGSNIHAGDQILVAVSAVVPNQALAVNLENFSAKPQSGKTLLEWSASAATNTAFFDVQYSTDQSNWQSIGTVQATPNGNTGEKYSFVHQNPGPGANYYRLRIVDLDTHYSFSQVRQLTLAAANLRLTGYPNPTKGAFTIVSNGSAITAVTIMSLDGKPLREITGFVSGNTIDLGSYPTGLYFIGVRDDSGATRLLKVFRD
jgi:hypothetical protein